MYYRIDWEALNRLPLPERMEALARIGEDVQRVTSAARTRLAVSVYEQHDTGRGATKAAAEALGIHPSRLKQIRDKNEESTTMVRIIPCDEPAELYRCYRGQHESQPCYVEVDLENQTVLATYNPEVGNSIPAAVYHGFERRYRIPALTSEAANRLMEEIRPFAERMVADWEEYWDGSNMKAVLGDDAKAAEAEIKALCGDPFDGWQNWDSSDCVTIWDVDSATNGSEAEEFGITCDTSDERLDEIEEEIFNNLLGISDSDEIVLEGVTEYLRDVRDNAPRESLIWSVVRGESLDAAAVEPGPHIAIPEEILKWAEGHGLSEEDPDVYLLVTTEDEAGDIAGEIAWRRRDASPEDAEKVAKALEEEAARKRGDASPDAADE